MVLCRGTGLNVHRKHIRLIFILLSISTIQIARSEDAPPPISKEVAENPSYWLKNTHSTTCQHSSVRTFKVDTREGDPLSLIIRQNVKGTVLVSELSESESKPVSNHKVQVAANWTSSNQEALEAVHNTYKVIDGVDEKLVLIELYVGDVESKLDMSPMVVGGTVAGFFVVLILIVVVLYISRRNNADPEMDGAMSQSLHSDADDDGDVEEEDDEGNETDYNYPDSNYLGESHKTDDDLSLNLSVVPGSHIGDTRQSLHSVPSVSGGKFSDTVRSSTTSLKMRRQPSRDSRNDDLPPPPPPPAEFDSSGSPLTHFTVHREHSDSETPPPPPPITSLNIPNIPPPMSSSGQTTPTGPIYAKPNKKGQKLPPARLPKPGTAARAIPQQSHSTSMDTDDTTSDSAETGPPRYRKSSGGSGGGGASLSSSLLGRTVMIVTIISVAMQAVYSLCHEDISVKVIIYVPKNTKINNIHLFSNQDKPSVFEKTTWYQDNMKIFKTFDVEDASATEETPCSPKLICPTATNQTHLGCDWATQKCVCTRGWKLDSKQVCVDVDECSMNRCPPEMSCTNLPGSFSCDCAPGHFWNGESCQSCSVGCPDGMFQSTICSSMSDRICSPCTECEGGTFTYQPCTTEHDSQCMETAYITTPCGHSLAPQVRLSNLIHWSDSNQVTIDSTPNVFVEELHKTANLSYPLFLTDNDQIMNFVWRRESGVRIFIHTSDFNLIPEFEDMEQDNDNSFVQSVLPEDISQLNKITYNYCRSPVPDHYTLTMNKYKERTTSVREIVCSTALKNCPPRFGDGQIYKFRTFNVKCPKTSPEYDSTIEVNRLSNEFNSVLCNERTPLLTDIFNETIRKDNPLTFPSIDCKQATWKCKECFSENRCGNRGANESCCAVSCHSLRVCKIAASEECTESPIECATGDTVQFLVQPYFGDLKKNFLCHIHRVEPKSVFTLSYQILVPTPDGWNSSRKTVDLPTAGESRATIKKDFFTIKYDNYLNTVDGDMLFKGDLNNAQEGYDFTLFEFKPRSEFNKTKVKPYKYESLDNRDTWTTDIQDESVSRLYTGVALAVFQNERPFEISTWNFNSKHGCYADVTKIHGEQPMYVNSTGQRVQIFASKKNDQGFKYKIRSVGDIPRVDFYLPGNESVLSHYFPNSTLDYESVSVELMDVIQPFYVYSIRITGQMKDCNSYLGLSVYDKTTKSVVALYDMMIFCSDSSGGLPTFDFHIRIPEAGSRNKLFAVSLKDSYTTVSYFVTTYSFASSLQQNNSVSLFTAEGFTSSEPVTVFAMLACLLVFVIAFAVLCVLIDHQVISISRQRKVDRECTYQKSRRRLLITLYCVLKMLYSVVFSFTIFLLLLRVTCSDDLTVLEDMTSYHLEITQLVERNIRAITDFKKNELTRQYDMKRERVHACSQYSRNSILTLTRFLDQYSTRLEVMKNQIEEKQFDMLMGTIQDYIRQSREHIDVHKRTLDLQITDIFTEYDHQLQDMMNNGWFNIPRQNFKAVYNKTQTDSQAAGTLTDRAVDFLAYIGVDRPSSALHQIKLLKSQLQEMYTAMSFDLEKNAGVGILSGLDTSSISELTLTKYDSDINLRTAEFATGVEAEVDTSSIKTLCWVMVIMADVLLFTYRMTQLSNTVHRLKYGYREEVDVSNNDTKSIRGSKENALEVEMNIIKRQINGDNEMSTNLLAHAEKVDENLNFSGDQQQPKKPGSRQTLSEAGSALNSDIESTKRSMTLDVKNSHNLTTERPGSAMSEPVHTQHRMRRNISMAASEPYGSSHQVDSSTIRTQKVSIQSLERAKNKNTQEMAPFEHEPQNSAEDAATIENKSSVMTGHSSIQPNISPDWRSKKIGQVLLSPFTIIAILLLAGLILSIVVILLVTDLFTYNSMVDMTNIDSMIAHIGVYASVVNSYLTTNAQTLSQMAQDTMVKEFNLHLHYIAKVKAIIESDVNWSLEDYSNKLCVLNGSIVDHCSYTPLDVGIPIMPCQSFPIEAVQFSDKENINTNLMSQRLQDYNTALVSLIITALGLVIFYLCSVTIIHIISGIVYSILSQKGSIHIVIVKYIRQQVAMLHDVPSDKDNQSGEDDKSRTGMQTGESEQADSQPLSDASDNKPPISSLNRQSALQDHLSGSTTKSNSSRRSNASLARSDEEDPLLKTIKAQSSVDTKEPSIILHHSVSSNQPQRQRSTMSSKASSRNQSGSETGF